MLKASPVQNDKTLIFRNCAMDIFILKVVIHTIFTKRDHYQQQSEEISRVFHMNTEWSNINSAFSLFCENSGQLRSGFKQPGTYHRVPQPLRILTLDRKQFFMEPQEINSQKLWCGLVRVNDSLKRQIYRAVNVGAWFERWDQIFSLLSGSVNICWSKVGWWSWWHRSVSLV